MTAGESDDWIAIQTYVPDAGGTKRIGSPAGSTVARLERNLYEIYPPVNVIDGNGHVSFQVRYRYNGDGRQLFTSEWSDEAWYEAPLWTNASMWATDNLTQANELGLIPECLEGADMTGDITRKEFAAVCVKVYENLGNTKALPVINNPFTDTNDTEVLKAYNVGITSGTAEDKFSPDLLLNREQAAAMLTRVFKRVTMTGWTLKTDTNPEFKLDTTGASKFNDDDKISAWAKQSVYFMVKNGIINGVGNNTFAPKNVTTEEQANGYANATREQALTIAVKMVQNLEK